MSKSMDQNKVVYIASDHAGFSAKDNVVQKIQSLGYQVEDLGPSTDDRVDYPDFANDVCHKLKLHPEASGVLICGSGQGMAMRANKFRHIRAALCWNKESAALSKQHNNANVLCVGSRLLDESTLLEIVETFFTESFEGGRHQGRVEKISNPLG